DVSIQAEVLNLLQDLRKKKHLTYILVSHDLAVVSHLCNKLLVMNRGQAVETITRSRLKRGTISEKYTKQLLVAGRGYDRAAIDRFEDF
ncbi:MAG: ABC transporter ATP-binding protein, partial [Desulfobacterales bacterium]|nr:ABC transporter ATP-binding protein [Desulfobacterales bacterium]